MRNSIILSLVIICLILLPQIAQAAEYYLDAVNGNDANPGTSDAPWQTLDRAYTRYSGTGTKVQEGDTVLFKNGNYGQFQENSEAGASQLYYRKNWITYKAAPGHYPDLTGILIRNNDSVGNNIGQSYLRFEGFHITGPNSVIPYGVVAILYAEYVYIKDCNIERAALPYAGAYAPYYWYDGDNVHIRGIPLQKARYITIDGCIIRNGYHGISAFFNTSDINIINNTVYHFGEDGILVVSDNGLIENNLVYDLHSFRVPINIQGTLTGSLSLGDAVTLNSNPVATGIYCGSTDGTHKIWITSAQSFFSMYSTPHLSTLRGTTITGPTGSISSITLADAERCDLVVIGNASSGGTTSNIIFNNNRLYRNYPGDQAMPAGGQALKLDGPRYATISNNLLVSNGSGDIGLDVALLMGGGTWDLNLVNNTIIGRMSMRNFAPATFDINNMYNNIVTDLFIDNDGASKPRIVNHGNNIFGNNPNGQGGPTYPFVVDTNTEIVNYDIDSLFVDAANNNFRLKENSAAINFGNPDYGPVTDILGNSRVGAPDAGCYEYGASIAVSGDINSDGSVDAIDLQLLINMILSGSFNSKADLNKDSSVDAIDLQALVNIILGR